MADALIGIVVPVMDGLRFLPETIESIQQQSCDSWICVVVDDGSSDGTGEWLDALVEQDARFRVVHQANRGTPVARNVGFNHLPLTRWVVFMDADDLWHQNALDVLLDAAVASPGAIGAHGSAEFIDEDGRQFGSYGTRVRSRSNSFRGIPFDQSDSAVTTHRQLLLASTLFPPGLYLLSRDVVLRSGLFDARMSFTEDWEFLLRVTRRGPIAFVDETVLLYRQHGGNTGARPEVRAQTALARRLHATDRSRTPRQRADARDAWRAAQVVSARELHASRQQHPSTRGWTGGTGDGQRRSRGRSLHRRHQHDTAQGARPPMRTNAILGAWSKLDARLAEPFIASARAEAPSAALVLFVGQMPIDDVRWLAKRVDEIVLTDDSYARPAPTFALDLVGRIKTTRGLRRHYPRAFRSVARLRRAPAGSAPAQALEYWFQGLQSLRYHHYLAYLQDHSELAAVLIADVRDVIFQADPFTSPSDGLEVFLESDSPPLSNPGFNQTWLRDLYGDLGVAEVAPFSVSCSGVTFGAREPMLHYLTVMVAELDRHLGPSGPHDQAVHNWLLHTGHLRETAAIQNGHGRVLTLGPDVSFDITSDGLVQQVDGQIPAVVHQYDRLPELSGQLKAFRSTPTS